jgi:molecular chaperone DnaJ
MAKSYFTILGVPSSASSDEIRSAYRRLAKEYHPDRFTGGSEQFLQIQEAYSVLGDPRKRAKYEQSLLDASMQKPATRRSYAGPEPLIPERRPSDLGRIYPMRSFETFTPSFDESFDWLWSNLSSLDWPKSDRLENFTLEIPLTPDQVMCGGNYTVIVPTRAVCPICRGYGGAGFYECSRCGGEGAIAGEVPVSISFPAGLREDHAVVIPLERFGIRNLRLTVLFRLAAY